MVDVNSERRTERRLRYYWPIWFAEDFSDTLSQGHMVDISSSGAAFSCRSWENCPHPGQRLTTRFSVPQFESEEGFNLASFTRSARVCRVDNVSDHVRKVAIQFAQPLPFRPGEQSENISQTEEILRNAIV